MAESNGQPERWLGVKVHTSTAWPASIVDHRIAGTDLWPDGGFLALLGPLGGVPQNQEDRWLREFTWYIDISSCWFHFAFTPSAAVQQRSSEILSSVYGNGTWAANGNFVAWHWRTGGQSGESGVIRGENKEMFRPRLQQLMSSLMCAHTTHGVSAPILVATDFNPMRKWLQQGDMLSLTTAPVVAQHIDLGGSYLQGYVDAIAEALTVAQARCVLISQSGFSNAALMMAKEPLCYMHMDVCLRAQQHMFNGVPIRRHRNT